MAQEKSYYQKGLVPSGLPWGKSSRKVAAPVAPIGAKNMTQPLALTDLWVIIFLSH